MPTFATFTLGCKVNQYETEYVREGLLRLGYTEVNHGEPADLGVVNTCTVTAEGDLKSRKAIRQFARRNPRAEIIVMGCYATRSPELVAELPGVAEVVTDKAQLPELLGRLGLGEAPRGISGFGRRHRAYVKVQDGCRQQCSYCIIPSVRPELRSRPVDEVAEEVAGLVGAGHREIVLTGIHLGHYGVDLVHGKGRALRRPTLARLVERLAGLPGGFRIRISSLEAAEVDRRLTDLVAGLPDRVCPHLHLSMQSGSDAVLRRMQRRYTRDEFIQRCRQIREVLDRPALTTDVIVGFPGETEADFEATCRTVEEIGFSKIHVFRFSPREGTPAADMPDQVPAAINKRRAADLASLGERLRRKYFESLLGRTMQVLVEGRFDESSGVLTGTSERYVPVQLPGEEQLIGRLVEVAAVGLGQTSEVLTGRLPTS